MHHIYSLGDLQQAIGDARRLREETMQKLNASEAQARDKAWQLWDLEKLVKLIFF